MPHRNPEAKKAYNKQYYSDHREEEIAHSHEYYYENREEILKASRLNQPHKTKYMRGYRRSKGIKERTIVPNFCGHECAAPGKRGVCEECWTSSCSPIPGGNKNGEIITAVLGPERAALYFRARRLWDYYKLTPEKFEKMKEDQEGKCACGRVLKGRTDIHVDHDHSCCFRKSCGKCVRGLLCQRCNTVLGMLEEDKRLLPLYLLQYLERTK
jgi:hypothetical protein